MSFDTHWERKVYSNGKQLNKYPYGELISVVFNSLKFLDFSKRSKSDVKIVELGSGGGNNLWFLSELGFKVYGVDGSKSACDNAIELQNFRGSKAEVKNAYFDSLPFNDEEVDVIIDRCATYCGTSKDVRSWWNEASRIIKRGGLIISFKFTDTHPDLKKILDGKLSAEKIEEKTYNKIESGPFKDTGLVNFISYDEIFEIFDFCDIKSIHKHTNELIYSDDVNEYNYSEWIIVGVKK